jgi:hypothetical protein
MTLHAANLVNGTNGDDELFVGLRATGGQGNTKNVVIDLGSVSGLAALPVGSVVSLGSIGTDLSFQYGSLWYERTDLLWSAVAGNSGTDISTNTLYGSVKSSTPGQFPLSTVGYTRAAVTAQGTIVTNIQSMAAGNNGFTAAAQGASPNIAIENTSDSNSWSSKFVASPFGNFSNPTASNFEQAFSVGTLAPGVEGALDIYRMVRGGTPDPDNGLNSGAGTFQLQLTIDSTGALTGTVLPAAVPEPASIGCLTSLALFAVGTLRRKRAAKA